MKRLLLISVGLLACSNDSGELRDTGEETGDIATTGEADGLSVDVPDVGEPDTRDDVANDASEDGVTDAADAPESSPEVDSRIQVSGACTNAMDAPFLDAPSLTNVVSCRTLCDSAECASQCLSAVAQVSGPCASCFVTLASCNEEFCGTDFCESGDCFECSVRECEPEFNACAGILADAEPRTPTFACLPTERELDLSSTEFRDIGNECSAGCGDGECVSVCLKDEANIGVGCAGCFADWWDCSTDECRGACDTQFSNECLECGGYSECKVDLLECLSLDQLRFADAFVLHATIRASILTERPHVAVVELDTSAPILRRLSAGQVTGFLEVALAGGSRLGVTDGNIGESAEIVAEVLGEVTADRDHTLTIYESAGELRGFLFEEPRLASASLRVFNGFAEPVTATVVDSDVSWNLDSEELGAAEVLLTPLTLVVDGLRFELPDLGPSASILVHLNDRPAGPFARATTSTGGFADMIGTAE